MLLPSPIGNNLGTLLRFVRFWIHLTFLVPFRTTLEGWSSFSWRVLQSRVLHVHLSHTVFPREALCVCIHTFFFPVPCEVWRVFIWMSLSSLQRLGYFSLLRDNNNIKMSVSLVHPCHHLFIAWEVHPCDNLVLWISSSFEDSWCFLHA